jgi:hypothetical protein
MLAASVMEFRRPRAGRISSVNTRRQQVVRVSGAGIVLLWARLRMVRGARHGRPDTHFFDRWDEGSRSEVVLL